MGSRKKQLYNYRILAIFMLVFLTAPGWKFTSGPDDAGFLSVKNSNFSFNGNFGNSIFSTDYGTDNDKIYIGFTNYFCGESKLGGDIDKVYTARAVQNISSNLGAADLNNLPVKSWAEGTIDALYKTWRNAGNSVRGEKDKAFNGKSSLNLSPVTTVKYVMRVTRFVELSATNKHGKKTYNISKGKLTQGICSINIDNTKISRSIYYYKLETDKGTVTKKWFC